MSQTNVRLTKEELMEIKDVPELMVQHFGYKTNTHCESCGGVFPVVYVLRRAKRRRLLCVACFVSEYRTNKG